MPSESAGVTFQEARIAVPREKRAGLENHFGKRFFPGTQVALEDEIEQQGMVFT